MHLDYNLNATFRGLYLLRSPRHKQRQYILSTGIGMNAAKIEIRRMEDIDYLLIERIVPS